MRNYCGRCGKIIEMGMQYCVSCGTEISELDKKGFSLFGIPLRIKRRAYDLLIVAPFLASILCILSHHSLTGLILIALGWYMVFSQQRGLSKEQTEVQRDFYAGFWVRLGSMLIDVGLFSLVFYLLFLIFSKSVFDQLYYQLYVVVSMLFEIYFLRWWGQTPGKMAMGIKIVSYDLSEMTWAQILLRGSMDIVGNIGSLLLALLFAAGFNVYGMAQDASFPLGAVLGKMAILLSVFYSSLILIWFLSEPVILLSNKKRRALHDYLAGTVVIRIGPAIKYSRLMAWASLFMLIANLWLIVNKDYFAEVNAAKGDPVHQSLLGSRYLHGIALGGIQQRDYSLALQWFQKAADQGYPEAQWFIGQIYEMGLGVNEDQAQAAQWYILAEKNGYDRARDSLKELNDPEHQKLMGREFYIGGLFAQDYKKAREWFQRAASQGNASAQGYLGEMYEDGLGVGPDKALAIHWYTQGAKNGDRRSKKALKRFQ